MIGQLAVNKQDDGDGVVTIAIAGEVDADVSEALATIILNAVGQPAVSELIIDLARVSFLDVAGVRSLLSGRQAALARGCGYHVVNPYGVVERVLRTLRMMEVLDVGTSPVRANSDSGPALRSITSMETPAWPRYTPPGPTSGDA